MDDEFRLTDGEKAQPLWLRLRAHLADQLAMLHVRNESASLTEAQTAALRGQIRCLRSIIALGDEALIIEAPLPERY